MLMDSLLVLAGLVLLVGGAESLVRGASGIALLTRVPPAVVGSVPSERYKVMEPTYGLASGCTVLRDERKKKTDGEEHCVSRDQVLAFLVDQYRRADQRGSRGRS